uniref:Fic family protein n=1 Tax=uncultured bacterium contig00056 TaxID=1181540 RepID=A0A806KCD9_9BACT|nr:Fic family protein [uncultured bacterium contig00056]
MPDIKNILITPQILIQIAELDEFKGSWNGFIRLQPQQLKVLKKVSTIESIGSSNRIEGNKLSDAQVEELLSRINKTSFKSRDEEEVAGYSDLMNTVFEDYKAIPLTENYIKQLHRILLKYARKDERHRGEYKKLSNSVAAFDSDGKEIGIVFETASPFDTPRFMEELIEWTRKNLNDPFLHPLIVIGIFIVHFLAIHPFQDGNGRLSRALTAMLLLKSGYAYVPYSSIESIIEINKEGYYRSLRRTQKNIWKGKIDYEPWLSYFLTVLQKQKRNLEAKIKEMTADDSSLIIREKSPAYGKPPVKDKQPDFDKLGRNALAVLALFDDKKEWSVPEIASTLKMNINTAAKTVKVLVEKSYLTKRGATKGAWYEKK